jgi:hypothetical protein
MEAIFVLLIAPILLVLTADPAIGFGAGAIFLSISIFYKQRMPCRITAFLTSLFWFYIGIRGLGSNNYGLDDFGQYVLPTVCALILSFGTQTCILSKNKPEPKEDIPPKTRSHLRYIKQSLRVGIEHEIIMENLVEQGVSPVEARTLLQSQLAQK